MPHQSTPYSVEDLICREIESRTISIELDSEYYAYSLNKNLFSVVE